MPAFDALPRAFARVLRNWMAVQPDFEKQLPDKFSRVLDEIRVVWSLGDAGISGVGPFSMRSPVFGTASAPAVAGQFSFVGIRCPPDRFFNPFAITLWNLTGLAVGPVTVRVFLDPGGFTESPMYELRGSPASPGTAMTVAPGHRQAASKLVSGSLVALPELRISRQAITVANNASIAGVPFNPLYVGPGFIYAVFLETVNQAISDLNVGIIEYPSTGEEE